MAQDDLSGNNRIYAYNRSTGSEDIGAGFINTVLENDPPHNRNPRGLTSDGQTMFVLDKEDKMVYAYRISYRTYDPNKTIQLDDDNQDAQGLWFDGEILWVVDGDDARVYPYYLPGAAKPTANPAPTGVPVITGRPKVGQTLGVDTSRINDDDGISGVTFSYQWISVDSTTETDITGATGATYVVRAEDRGKTLKVRVSFTDGAGHAESLISFQTSPVFTAPPPVYEGTLTVGFLEGAAPGYIRDSNIGSFSPQLPFEIAGVTYTVTILTVAGGEVNLTIAPGPPPNSEIALTLDSTEFDPDSISQTLMGTRQTAFVWPVGGPSWANGQLVSVTLSVTTDICDRGPFVQQVILAATPAADACDSVSYAELAAITELDFPNGYTIAGLPSNEGIGARNGAWTLQAGDFEGLTGLTRLDLSNSRLSGYFGGTLTGVDPWGDAFAPLTNLVELDLSGNEFFDVMPENLFDDLGNLEILRLKDNRLYPRLADGVFNGLGSLRELDLRGFSVDPSGMYEVHRKRAWDPRKGSPLAFIPLTSLVTYNVDPAAPYATNNYTQPPPSPQNLSFTAIPIPVPSSVTGWESQHTITLTWDAPAGVTPTGYRVERLVGNQYPWDRAEDGKTYPENFDRYANYVVGQTALTYYTDGRDRSLKLGGTSTDLVHHASYAVPSATYFVSAITADGVSFPASVTVTTPTNPPTATAAPSPPGPLRRSHHQGPPLPVGQYFHLEWEPSGDPTVTGYEIQYRRSPSPTWLPAVADAGNVTDYGYPVAYDIYLLSKVYLSSVFYTFTACDFGCLFGIHEHEFRIRAINAAGTSDWVSTLQPLGLVRSLTATGGPTGKLRISAKPWRSAGRNRT